MTDTTSPRNMPGSRPITAEMLLAHQPWMRALARRLVVDEHEADDLVQDAWLAALEKPPAKTGSLGAWLGSVIRNGAKQLARGESRRGQRERRASKPEALEATSDVVARAEAQGIVVQAVLGLPEPARTTVLLRFFDGLPPRKIAKQLGCPVETVRARIRRALEKMRADLDEQHGSRRAWALPLIPLARLAAPGGDGSATAAGAGTATAVALSAVLGLAGGYVAQRALEDGAPPPTTTTVEVAAGPSVERQRLERELHAVERHNDALRERLAALPEPASTDAGPEPAAPEPTPRASIEPRFALGRHRDALLASDWRAIGEAVRNLYRLNGPIVDAVAAGTPPDPDMVGRSQTENAPLVVAALQWSEAGVTGSSANGAFTHPVVLANILGAVLDVADVPLSTAQRTSFERLAAEYGEREDARARRAAETEGGVLQDVLDESRLRHAFVRDARALLSEAQLGVLGPAHYHDRTGTDIVTAALVWNGNVRLVDGSSRATLVREIAGRVGEELGGLDTATRDALEAAVRKWDAARSDAERAVAADGLERAGLIQVDVVHTWAERTIALLDDLQQLDGLTDAQRDVLRRWSQPFVPLRRTEPK